MGWMSTSRRRAGSTSGVTDMPGGHVPVGGATTNGGASNVGQMPSGSMAEAGTGQMSSGTITEPGSSGSGTSDMPRGTMTDAASGSPSGGNLPGGEQMPSAQMTEPDPGVNVTGQMPTSSMVAPAAPKTNGDASAYAPAFAGLEEGHVGDDVARLQRYLQRFGYLRSDELKVYNVPSDRAAGQVASIGSFDVDTALALKRFQEFHGLPITG